jgi:hypothetical protein
MMKNPNMVSCTAALNPTRRQLGFASGKRARRAGTCLVPMCCFQASEFAERPRLGLNPTPNGLLVGGSAIIVAIRSPPLAKIRPGTSIRGHRSFDFSSTERVFYQYERTDGARALE